MLSPDIAIAVTATALVVVSGYCVWAVLELRHERRWSEVCRKTVGDRNDQIDRLTERNRGLRAYNMRLAKAVVHYQDAESKRQAQRVAASHAAAEKRRVKNP